MTTTTAMVTECPKCRQTGKTVGPITLRALLKDEYSAEVTDSEQSHCEIGCKPPKGDTGWRFCDSPNCDVVYFGEQQGVTFTKDKLAVPVGVKETTGERPLCYCFGHSVASIKKELQLKGRSDALDDIRAKMKDLGCHCETSNPSGSCCLGSVAKGIQIAKEELGMSSSNVTSENQPNVSTDRGERIAKIGTLASAVMASACCWLPLVLLAVGVSGAGIASTLETYRPVFIVVTVGFLAAAFYFTYRPKKAYATAGHGCCAAEGAEAETCCPPNGKRRFSMMALNKLMLWVVTVLAVAFLLFPSYVGVLFGTGNEGAVTESMNWAVFQIDGMTCEGCATTVAQAIRQVPGVAAVEVSYERRQAVVGTESGRPFPRDEVLTAIEEAGYYGSVMETK